MVHTVQQTVYQAFGMRLVSELSLPEVLQAAEQKTEADVEIKLGDLSGDWSEFGTPDDFYAYTDHQFLFYVPDTAIFSIRGGKQIIVSPLAGSVEKSIRLYLLGTCMGAILIQRRILPLHGSAVVMNGRAYAFIGDSGAGKSTLAAAFLQNGYPLLSDDVIAIKLDGINNHPIVIPAYPQQKLWQQSIDHLGMEANRYQTIYDSKYAVPVSSNFCAQPVPLAGLFEIVKSEAAEVEMVRHQGLERLAILSYHTYRNFLIPQLGGNDWHFSTIASMGSKVNMYQLRRPSVGLTVHDLISRVLHIVNEGAV
ncbi:aldolase [Paenibacillus sedimenti]|uniref:Aldolase n=1 Tax=Paenibacillus sedimenti TaxID=2770274 RepID=A0A926KLY4_9BACL|nr:aldolase [Paenibacillus sedimenti]MBD0379732.1 aldolase [Paenibacillus sedimenti]